MNVENIIKHIVAFLIINLLLIPAYFWFLLSVALGIGATDNMHLLEKLYYLSVALIPYLIETGVFYLLIRNGKFKEMIEDGIIPAIQLAILVLISVAFPLA